MTFRSFLKALLFTAVISGVNFVHAAKPIVRSIKFGSTGGFTGGGTYWKLEENGKLTGQSFTTPTSTKDLPTKNIDKATVEEVFHYATQLEKYSYHKPGNLTVSVSIIFDTHMQKMTWAMRESKVDIRARNLYSKLMALTRDEQ